MANHRLREAIYAAGLTPQRVAADLDVDPKTVERWMTQARVPYPRHRVRLALALGTTEDDLWPDLAAGHRHQFVDDPLRAAEAEIVRLYPHRSSVGQELWRRLVLGARERVDVLAHAGLFLFQQHPHIVRLLRDKAAAGARVRLLLGDPGAAGPARRGGEDASGDTLRPGAGPALDLYRPLVGQPGVAVRLHRTTLYASIYHFDDEMLVNIHVYGLPAAHAPVLHLRRVSFADLYETYVAAFERVWQDAGPVPPGGPASSDGVSGSGYGPAHG